MARGEKKKEIDAANEAAGLARASRARFAAARDSNLASEKEESG
jgi:hypothetical protein